MVPLILLVLLGVVEVGYALMDQQAVTRMTREGSNLISRDVSIQDATAAMKNMAAKPIDFNASSTMIFSVIKRGALVGSANYDKLYLYQRYSYGSLSASSKVTASGGSFGGAPNYFANNPDTDAALRVTSVPSNLVTTLGGMIYVTEIVSKHKLITPFDKFGVKLPEQLYSIAYF